MPERGRLPLGKSVPRNGRDAESGRPLIWKTPVSLEAGVFFSGTLRCECPQGVFVKHPHPHLRMERVEEDFVVSDAAVELAEKEAGTVVSFKEASERFGDPAFLDSLVVTDR